MAGKVRRVTPSVLMRARAALRGLCGIRGYQPRDEAYSIEALMAMEHALAVAEQEELLAFDAYRVACEATIVTSHALCEGMKGAKREVLAQFGENSYAVEAVGLKRKIDYRPRTRLQDAVE